MKHVKEDEMKHAKEDITYKNDSVIDFNSAVEGLHGFSSQELSKLLKDSENFTIQLTTGKGSVVKIDMEKLAWSLPLHLIAVLVLHGGCNTQLKYLFKGVRLLHSMCDLASRHTRLEQILLEEVKVTEQILDLVFYVLVILAGYEQESRVGTSLPLLHAALVGCSLHLLTGYVSSQWQDLVHVLLVHPKLDIFMDVSFDAVRVAIMFFHKKFAALDAEVLCNKSSFPAAERTAYNLCQHCEVSLQFLQFLCQQKLFRERLLKNKELCRNGGILLLAQAILKLNIPSHFKGSSIILAAISRMKSKILSILLQLCETESISYLDEVASSSKSMGLARSIGFEVIELLKAAFSTKPEKLNDGFASTNPMGLVLLNSMRLADIFSDDSNFRSFIVANITQVVADVLVLPQEDFLYGWCSTNHPVMEEDATLEYDPFMAAGVVLALNGTNEINCAPSLILNRMPPVSHAQQRTSFLVKIIANLHCFVPNICEEQEKDQFINKIFECLHIDPTKSSSTFSYTSDTQKASTVCENLSSLVDYAVSLIPSFLNDEDVQLLSVFFEKLQQLISSAQTGGDPSQDPDVKDDDKTQDKNFEDSCFNRQNTVGWAKFPNIEFGDRSQVTGSSFHVLHSSSPDKLEAASSLRRRVDPTTTEESPDFINKKCNTKGTSNSSMFPDLEFKVLLEKGRSATGRSSEVDKDIQNVQASCSNVSSMKGKNGVDQIIETVELPQLRERVRDTASKIAQESEKVEALPGEEKQTKKRKRNIMNEKQIMLIERALVDEPEMQRNAALVQTWADKLSPHGSEITSSQLKNWLNNRKAKLARAAREARAPSDGENAFPDKATGSNPGQFYDSPDSPGEDFYVPVTTARANPNTFVDFAAQCGVQMNMPSFRYVRCEPGQYVALVDGKGKEIGRGKVYQIDGRWHGKNLEEAGVCIVDIVELKVDRWTRLPHPSESAGMTFEEAETHNGVMRVAWDANKTMLLPQ